MVTVNEHMDEKKALREKIAHLGLSINGFARLARVSDRTVRHWLDDNKGRPIPPYSWGVLALYEENLELKKKLSEIANAATMPDRQKP
jgi:hypothetical protein